MSLTVESTEPTMSETPEVSGNSDIGADTKPSAPTQTLTPAQTSTQTLSPTPAQASSDAYAEAVATAEPDNTWIRRVALLLTGQAFSLLGSSIVQYAIWWWIVLQTNSGMGMLLATLFGVVPQSIVSIFGGSWADRHNRKLLIMLPDMVIAAVTVVLSLSFAMGWASLTLIFVCCSFARLAAASRRQRSSRSFQTLRPPANCYVSIQYMA
mgnify:CR=1 FL=1